MKMTMQDLIVGHYEGVLTPSQQQELQALLASSPEARAIYERHGVMQEAMEEESERLIPPIALRQATIGAALGVAAESVGGGIAAWFTTKVAVAIGTVVVGGAAAGIILSNSGDDEQGKTPPAAVTAPAATDPAPAPDNETVERAQSPAVGQPDNTDVAPALRPTASAANGRPSGSSGGRGADGPTAAQSSANEPPSLGNDEEQADMPPKTTVKSNEER